MMGAYDGWIRAKFKFAAWRGKTVTLARLNIVSIICMIMEHGKMIAQILLRPVIIETKCNYPIHRMVIPSAPKSVTYVNSVAKAVRKLQV